MSHTSHAPVLRARQRRRGTCVKEGIHAQKWGSVPKTGRFAQFRPLKWRSPDNLNSKTAENLYQLPQQQHQSQQSVWSPPKMGWREGRGLRPPRRRIKKGPDPTGSGPFEVNSANYFSTIARMSRAERIRNSSPEYLTSVPPYLL